MVIVAEVATRRNANALGDHPSEDAPTVRDAHVICDGNAFQYLPFEQTSVNRRTEK